MPDQRVGGIIQFQIDGEVQQAKGSFTYGLGIPKREAVVGSDVVHGYKETPVVAFIEGEITDSQTTNLRSLASITGATVTLDLANGKMVVLRSAWYAGDAIGNTDEGNIDVRFEGSGAEEVGN